MSTVGQELPLLLPQSALPGPSSTSALEWKPQRYLSDPQPPPVDEAKIQEQELANARQLLDGKQVKKTRPRRTVDYNAGMGRWTLMRKLRPSPSYVPYLRPSPPYIIDLLPPKAYPENSSTSLCTKFVHTSTNKIRCPVNVVTWTPEGRRVLTGSTSGEFTLWNGLTFNFETILQAHDTAICTFSFTHSGAYLASADKSGVIKYFEPNMNNLTAWQGSNSKEAIRGISFSPNDQRFATASDDSSVRIWSFHESRVESVLTGHGWDVKCVQWHPTKGLLVSGSKDNQIKFWDPRTGTVLSTLHQHKNTVQALAWSPNGNQVASASRDQTVRIFDIRAMKEYTVCKGHKKEVCSVAWHPFHPILVSGGSEGSILHWDLTTTETTGASGQTTTPPRATLSEAHDSNVWSLAYHPLGHLLVSASNDHTTRFWSRERPGDQTSVFSAGGEKPPGANAADTSTAQDEYDQDDSMMVPGMSIPGMGWGVKEEESFGMSQSAPNLSNPKSGENGYGSRAGGGGGGGGGGDFIPGFGGGSGLGNNSFGGGGRDVSMRDDRDRSRDRYDDDRDRDYDRRGGGGGGRGYRDRDDDRGRDRGGGRNSRWSGGGGRRSRY